MTFDVEGFDEEQDAWYSLELFSTLEEAQHFIKERKIWSVADSSYKIGMRIIIVLETYYA